VTATAVPVAGSGVLPDGFRIALDPGVRWADGGTVLVGGAPIRLLRFTPAGRALVDRLAAGEPVPHSTGAQMLARRLLDAGLAHPRPSAPDSTTEVAVVIPVRNDAQGLASTLSALPDSAAIVVVDDASSDADTVSLRGTGATLLRRSARGGPAAARNDGWRATDAAFVAFVDANCEPEPGWLEILLPHFADPEVAAVAPRILPPSDLRKPGALAAYEAVASPLDLGAREANVRPGSPVAYVPTAALVVRRSALNELGGFDETLTVGEDVDFVWRLVAAGWTVRYEPRAVVRHPIRSSWPAWVQQRFRYGTSAAPLARRHGWAVAPAVMSPWTAGAWALVAAGQPLLGVMTAGASVAALRRQVPEGEAVRLAGIGHLQGGLGLARALRRAWAPVAVLLALTGRRDRAARAGLAAVAVAPGVVDWFQRRPGLDPVRFGALRLADDLAYAGGVWAGCARERSARALLPDLRNASRRRVRQTYDPVSTIGGDQ
jgi:mycofactocin system glycosyltransferase